MTTMSIGRAEQLSTNQTEGAPCAVCSKNKYRLRRRMSKLNGHQLLVCNDCFENKYEPRWLVIITAQDETKTAQEEALVKYIIVNHKYVGAEIPAADLYR